MLAEKLGLEKFEYKYLGLLDYLGFMGLCSSISAFLMREKVRERYGIEGSTGEDCLISFCCLECAVCQMTKQVDEA